MEFSLNLRATGYLGGPAGTSGDEFSASDRMEGKFAEQILYIDKTKAVSYLRSVFERLKDNRSDVKTGYVDSESSKILDDMNVKCNPAKDRATLQRIGPGAYALYRLK